MNGSLWKQAASREAMISKIIKEYKYSQEGFEVKIEWIEVTKLSTVGQYLCF